MASPNEFLPMLTTGSFGPVLHGVIKIEGGAPEPAPTGSEKKNRVLNVDYVEFSKNPSTTFPFRACRFRTIPTDAIHDIQYHGYRSCFYGPVPTDRFRVASVTIILKAPPNEIGQLYVDLLQEASEEISSLLDTSEGNKSESCGCNGEEISILATCNQRKNDINDRFHYTKFGSCSHPNKALAESEALALSVLLQAEHPGCPGLEFGAKSTSGAGFTTWLSYAACRPR